MTPTCRDAKAPCQLSEIRLVRSAAYLAGLHTGQAFYEAANHSSSPGSSSTLLFSKGLQQLPTIVFV
jgi:hypothetical protein